ncbi:MAG: hypothetical protein JWQ38_2937 [Flavipsychrobacter sp.]|nr:hypothetical protein [Flavipsychrobacter sp.]
MATLQEVHNKLQELCNSDDYVPLTAFLKEFDNDAEVKQHIRSLVQLEFIELHRHPDLIFLTLSGRLTIPPLK